MTNKAPEQIRIKTLEEIRQEKAAKSQPGCQNNGPSGVEPENTKSINTKATRGAKRAITVGDESVGHVKTISEILRAKKKRQEEEQQQQKHSPKRAKLAGEKTHDGNQAEPNTAGPGPGPGPEATKAAEVRVKTLEEIRREKAARQQAQQAPEPDNKKSSDAEENGAKKPRLLRINKLAPQSKTAVS